MKCNFHSVRLKRSPKPGEQNFRLFSRISSRAAHGALGSFRTPLCGQSGYFPSTEGLRDFGRAWQNVPHPMTISESSWFRPLPGPVLLGLFLLFLVTYSPAQDVPRCKLHQKWERAISPGHHHPGCCGWPRARPVLAGCPRPGRGHSRLCRAARHRK